MVIADTPNYSGRYMHSRPIDLVVPRHIRWRFIVYTVHNFCDCSLKILNVILSNISEQHLNNVGVRRRIGLKIVETLSVYFKKNVSCVYSSRYGSQNVLGCFINLLRVKLSFTLERAASNEYSLQTFSLRNKKERFGYPLVLTWF